MKFSGTVAVETVRSTDGLYLDLGATLCPRNHVLQSPLPLIDENGFQVGLIDELIRYESLVVCSGTGDWGVARVYARARRTYCSPVLAIGSQSSNKMRVTTCRIAAVRLARDPVWEHAALVWYDTPTLDQT